MKEWTVEFDTNDCGGFTEYYAADNLWDVIEWTEETLEECDGGHADIYDEGGNFVEDVEV